MILYPAIDLKDGTCVRLLRGEMASATVFNPDPAAQAQAFAEAGFSWLRHPARVTVAVVQGHAIGAGFQLALECASNRLSLYAPNDCRRMER